MVLVAKCGSPLEADSAKPGNRGKRDSQVMLMAFMQKVMFDERMTTFEFEFFNSLWRVTGVSPDHYEIVLMVDADTKVFPDSLTRMVSCMVEDPEIMGLCGETKIANKTETWVTMIQGEFEIEKRSNRLCREEMLINLTSFPFLFVQSSNTTSLIIKLRLSKLVSVVLLVYLVVSRLTELRLLKVQMDIGFQFLPILISLNIIRRTS